MSPERPYQGSCGENRRCPLETIADHFCKAAKLARGVCLGIRPFFCLASVTPVRSSKTSSKSILCTALPSCSLSLPSETSILHKSKSAALLLQEEPPMIQQLSTRQPEPLQPAPPSAWECARAS